MPRDTLTREKIVKAAIDLLDSDGLEGLNIRALGSRLGSAATAIYWHVGSKDNLMALAADQAWNEITLPDPAAVGWRDAAMAMAAGLHAMLTRHPWLVQALAPSCCPVPARPATTTTPSPSTRRPDSAASRPTRQRPPSSPSCWATPSARPQRRRLPASSPRRR